MKKSILFLILCAAGSMAAWSQKSPAASRLGDLQVGGSFSSANADFGPDRLRGYGAYADFDFTSHFGAEVDFHQLTDPNGSYGIYERSYEFGGRYVRHYSMFAPYVRAMYGRGVFNFPYNEANLAYNMVDLGGGVDISVHPRINVRVEYEYQRWLSFPPNGLTPSMITVGAAYHFPAGKPKRIFGK